MSVVLRRTVVGSGDWRFKNLSGSHLQSYYEDNFANNKVQCCSSSLCWDLFLLVKLTLFFLNLNHQIDWYIKHKILVLLRHWSKSLEVTWGRARETRAFSSSVALRAFSCGIFILQLQLKFMAQNSSEDDLLREGIFPLKTTWKEARVWRCWVRTQS